MRCANAVPARVRRDVGHRADAAARAWRAPTEDDRADAAGEGEREARRRRRSRSALTALLIAAPRRSSAFRFVAKGWPGQPAATASAALFHDATGLVDKSRVQIAGLNIGEIVDRRLEGAAARITMRDQARDRSCGRTRRVFKKSASLLGEFYLEIDPGTAESPDPMTGKIHKNHRAQGRRSDQERRRGGDHLGHPGAGQRDAAGAARDPHDVRQDHAGAAAGHRAERAAPASTRTRPPPRSSSATSIRSRSTSAASPAARRTATSRSRSRTSARSPRA